MHSRRKHLVSGVHLEGTDGSLEEVNDLLVLLVVGAIASNIESRRASRVLGELVSPEDSVGVTLVDPVLLH